MESGKFITVWTFTFAYEVAVIRSRFESEGITCFVQDELTVQVHPFYSNAIGGVKLQVRESDLHHAIEILKEAGYIKDKDLQPSKDAPRLNEYSGNQENTKSKAKTACPICGSEETIKDKKAGWLFLLSSLLFMFPTPLLQKRYYCFDCKQEFKVKKQRNRP
ncbi:MAG: DUF2007 domain-containing protein [Prevotellaceae bacterium]|jgi:DNA-directed RNA polymerase subunit RPC12/RpoP|nr:DUF2007 domain-containing protein [Prevotellaceae bacterium]